MHERWRALDEERKQRMEQQERRLFELQDNEGGAGVATDDEEVSTPQT